MEGTTGFEPTTPTLAMAWRMPHASPPVSPVPLRCRSLALLSHASHQMLESTQFSLVISLVDSDPRKRHTVPTVEGPGSVPSDPLPYRAGYPACKAFIVTFTVSLHRELQGTGVRLMVCCPGLVESEFTGRTGKDRLRSRQRTSSRPAFEGWRRARRSADHLGIEDPQVVEALDAAERAMIAHTRGRPSPCYR